MNVARAFSIFAVVGLLAGCAGARPATSTVDPWHTAFAAADSLRVTRVADGVDHVFAWDRSGPWAIHVLAIDPRQCSPDLEAVHAGPPLTAAGGTTALSQDALAGLNGDFFAMPAGTPVGAMVTDGEIIVGPGRRPVFGIDGARYWAGTATLRGHVREGSDSIAVGQVNRPLAGDNHHPRTSDLTLFTHWWGRPPAGDSAATTVGVQIIDGTPSRGRGVIAAVTSTANGTVAIGPDRIAFQGPATREWLRRRTAGDTVSWDVRIDPPASQVIGGFPVLLAGGAVADPGERVIDSFGPARHPRTAIGWNARTRQLLWVVVDGRNARYSDGMTLAELTSLFQRIGATDAINLDGGGSTTLVIGGRIVNRTSDRTGERPVGNALVLKACTAQ